VISPRSTTKSYAGIDKEKKGGETTGLQSMSQHLMQQA
jgi:hypothetical protein